MTRGILYKFAILNSPTKIHLGKLSISPTWWIQICSNQWGWKEDITWYLRTNFQTLGSIKFVHTIEKRSDNYVEEIEETRVSCFGHFPPPISWKRNTIKIAIEGRILIWNNFLSIQNFNFLLRDTLGHCEKKLGHQVSEASHLSFS